MIAGVITMSRAGGTEKEKREMADGKSWFLPVSAGHLTFALKTHRSSNMKRV